MFEMIHIESLNVKQDPVNKLYYNYGIQVSVYTPYVCILVDAPREINKI